MPPYPASLAVVATLAVVGGLEAVYDTFTPIQSGHLTIDLGVILLPLGIGLFLRSNTCRVLLAILLLLALILIPFMICLISALAAGGAGQFYLTWFGQQVASPTPAQVVLSLAWAAGVWLLTLWAYRVLRSDRARIACGAAPRQVAQSPIGAPSTTAPSPRPPQ